MVEPVCGRSFALLPLLKFEVQKKSIGIGLRLFNLSLLNLRVYQVQTWCWIDSIAESLAVETGRPP